MELNTEQRGSKAEFITAAVVEVVKHGLLTRASLDVRKQRAGSKALTARRGGAFGLEAADKKLSMFWIA